MRTQMVRIEPKAHQTLRQLAKLQERSMRAVLTEAIENYRRSRILDEMNASYARLKRDRRGWADEKKARRLWDRTLTDGNQD